ncbi:unnamed protein product [Schistosoma curassoni]|uniref:Transposase n=1 Tax=Schistosoma curassoni TaxID=6186 RepID=A0A183JFP8_9TREM|nr:unnamed protein product [Schistosoma curassoni]
MDIRPAWKIILEIENLKLEILKPITDQAIINPSNGIRQRIVNVRAKKGGARFSGARNI